MDVAKEENVAVHRRPSTSYFIRRRKTGLIHVERYDAVVFLRRILYDDDECRKTMITYFLRLSSSYFSRAFLHRRRGCRDALDGVDEHQGVEHEPGSIIDTTRIILGSVVKKIRSIKTNNMLVLNQHVFFFFLNTHFF